MVKSPAKDATTLSFPTRSKALFCCPPLLGFYSQIRQNPPKGVLTARNVNGCQHHQPQKHVPEFHCSVSVFVERERRPAPQESEGGCWTDLSLDIPMEHGSTARTGLTSPAAQPYATRSLPNRLMVSCVSACRWGTPNAHTYNTADKTKGVHRAYLPCTLKVDKRTEDIMAHMEARQNVRIGFRSLGFTGRLAS